MDLAKWAGHPAAPCSTVICLGLIVANYTFEPLLESELWPLQLVLPALDVDEVEARCGAGVVLHSRSSVSMDSYWASVGLVTDVADVDGAGFN